MGIGDSAGGLAALIEFFKQVPANSQLAFVVAMHLLRGHRSLLDHILSKHTALPVVRVEKHTLLEVGNVYLIVENRTMIVEDGFLIVRLRDDKVINSSINILFESLASDFKEKAIGVVLSGAGDDGLKGAKKITELGGRVIVQDPDSAQVDGMPCSVILGDHPAAILTPAEIAGLVNKMGLA